jgi:hypothetical protein
LLESQPEEKCLANQHINEDTNYANQSQIGEGKIGEGKT